MRSLGTVRNSSFVCVQVSRNNSQPVATFFERSMGKGSGACSRSQAPVNGYIGECNATDSARPLQLDLRAHYGGLHDPGPSGVVKKHWETKGNSTFSQGSSRDRGGRGGGGLPCESEQQ